MKTANGRSYCATLTSFPAKTNSKDKPTAARHSTPLTLAEYLLPKSFILN